MKGKVCLVVLVASLMVVCVSFSQAKEDPELRQCQHQCRHQEQFDERQKLGCEKSCEEYIRQKERIRKEREDSNSRRDPQKEYRVCRERCQEDKEGRREQQVCESKCEKERRESERQREGRDDLEFEREREREGEEREGSGHPYVFQDEQFDTQMKTQQGRVRVLPKFTERSKLFKGIENYRVLFFEANPQTFVVPNYWDADAIFFVAQGRGTVTLVFTDKRESFNIEKGHVMVIPAGVTAYLVNRDDNQKLVLAKLINPVSNPGKFQPFFASGGQNSESLFGAFSDEVLEAAFKTSSERIQKIFSQQRDGVFIKASKEQIRALTQGESTRWPFGSKGSKDFSPVNLFRQRSKESNEFGTLFELDINDNNNKILQDLDITVAFANITRGAMHVPHYNSRSTKIAMVINGRGEFEMACPHVSESGRQERRHESGRSRRGEESTTTPVRYQKIRSELKPGTVYIVPPGHPFVTIASESDNLQVVCFEINAENNQKFTLAGQKNVLKNFERVAKELAFGTSAEEVDRVFESQDEEFFFRGPRQQRRHRDFSII